MRDPLMRYARGRRPRKVLYISPVGERGGAEALLRDLLKFHDPDAFDPSVVFLRDGPFVDEVKGLGIDTIVIKSTRVRNAAGTARAISQLCSIVAQTDAHLIASNMPLAHLYGGPAGWMTKRKSVWFAYGTLSYWPATDWLASRLHTAGVFACALDVANSLCQFLPRRYRDSVRLFPMGVDLSKLDPSIDGAQIRAEFGIPADAPLVGMVARFQRWKGQDYFVRAAAIVVRARPDARFLLVGDTQFGLEPEFKEELVLLIHRLGLEGSVILTGFRDDLPQCLGAIDIVVHGYIDSQPGGLIMLDAMAMAKPVIATDCGDRSEWMVPDETGILIPAKNPERMAAAIISLIDDRNRASRMGICGRRRIETRFSVEAMIAQVEGHYREILDGHAKQRPATTSIQ